MVKKLPKWHFQTLLLIIPTGRNISNSKFPFNSPLLGPLSVCRDNLLPTIKYTEDLQLLSVPAWEQLSVVWSYYNHNMERLNVKACFVELSGFCFYSDKYAQFKLKLSEN